MNRQNNQIVRFKSASTLEAFTAENPSVKLPVNEGDEFLADVISTAETTVVEFLSGYSAVVDPNEIEVTPAPVNFDLPAETVVE